MPYKRNPMSLQGVIPLHSHEWNWTAALEFEIVLYDLYIRAVLFDGIHFFLGGWGCSFVRQFTLARSIRLSCENNSFFISALAAE